eukprot:scaffold86516_cov28-Tisochrysis_lutea.AAC.3
MPKLSSVEAEVLVCNERLLKAIERNDWGEYERLSDPSVSCIEAETQGQLVEGLPFHKVCASPSAVAFLPCVVSP